MCINWDYVEKNTLKLNYIKHNVYRKHNVTLFPKRIQQEMCVTTKSLTELNEDKLPKEF